MGGWRFEPNDRGVCVEDKIVINGYRSLEEKPNHHKIYGYLRTPELQASDMPMLVVGTALREPLCDGQAIAIALERPCFVTGFEQCVADRAMAYNLRA
jgi:hypothetical protein